MMFDDAAMPDFSWGQGGRMDPEAKLDFELRRARPEDFPFAEAVYIASMRPLMEQLGAWNETQRRDAFRRSFKTSEARMIMRDEKDIGWLQLNERDTDFNLAQIQILPAHCGSGIGTRIILDLLKRARRKGKTVSLSAVRTNRAIALYQRLGFRVIDPDAIPIIDMVWSPDKLATEPAATRK
jgi:ribosomal protein S18 acetylase RimI-like enzyme